MATVGDEVTERDNTAYKPRYGDWAGNPQGHRPDYDACCFEVFPNERGAIPHQCRKKRGFGPGLAYCKQHDPGAVQARRDAADEKYRVESNKRRYQWYGRAFYDALEQIANGHNDARGLAQQIIAEFKAGER